MFTLFITLTLFVVALHEVSAECKFHATLLRQLRKEGFHLSLISTVEIIVGSEVCPAWENCTLALADTIGSSFFVNPDEVSASNICIKEPVDTEAPETLSSSFVVYLYSQLSRSLNLIHCKLQLPLHMRYHSPQTGGGYILTDILRPSILLQCKQDTHLLFAPRVRAPCSQCSDKSCYWVEIPFKSNADNLTIPVPVGNSDHLVFVTVITYLLAFGGCLYSALAVLNLCVH